MSLNSMDEYWVPEHVKDYGSAPRCWKFPVTLALGLLLIFPSNTQMDGQFFHGRIGGRIIPDKASQGVTKGAPGFPRTPLSTCGNACFETIRDNP